MNDNDNLLDCLPVLPRVLACMTVCSMQGSFKTQAQTHPPSSQTARNFYTVCSDDVNEVAAIAALVATCCSSVALTANCHGSLSPRLALLAGL